MPDKIPPNELAKLEEFRRKATHNGALNKEYNNYYNRNYVKDQPTFEQWLAMKGKVMMADGGSARDKALQKYLAESQVKHPVYHVAKTDVKEFSPKHRTELSSMGHHFGTAEQANFRMGQYDFESKHPNIGKYHLNIKKPLEVSHMGSFAPDHLAEQMMDMGILDPDKYDAMSEKHSYSSLPLGNELVKILKKHGYDGLMYANEREGEGHSYVPFEPHQVKSAIGNRGTYDPNEHDITKANGGDVSLKEMQDYIANKNGTYEGRRFERASPREPGSTPIKEGHVRLYHQTDGDNLREIEKHGLLLKHARGIEGPRAIYAGETPFYGDATKKPTLEFQVPKEHWDNPFVLRDVHPEDFISAHYPWHRHARYLEDETGIKNVLSGKFDTLKGDEGKAVAYIKNKYSTNKAKGGIVSMLRKHGQPVNSHMDAMKRQSNGHHVYAFHEQDETPREIKSMHELQGYTPEQIYTIHPQHLVEHKAKGGSSSIKEMQDYIANQGGGYEGRRFERAADEVPHLMETYDPEALKSLFRGDNAKALMTMDPADFEKYATPIHERFVTGHRYASEEGQLPMLSHEDYIKHLANTKRFKDVPYLEINKEHQGRKELPFISGHEGRHRNRALSAKGLKTGLVQLLPRAELREPFPRRKREDYINALRNELSLMGNKVRPEKIKDEQSNYGEAKRRSIIQLPDLYAGGGDVQGKPMNTPTLAQMRHSINTHGNPEIMDNIGINEAMDMDPKIFVSPNPHDTGVPATGGVADSHGLPIGGVDTNNMQPGQQLNPQPMGQQQQPGQPPAPSGAPGGMPSGPTPPEGNMLSMTPQGQTMQAMQPQGQPPQGLAEGGQPKRMFKIQSAGHQEKRKEPEFTPYEPKDISIKKLARAFDEAIAHHRSLPNEERIMNSFNAAQKLGKIIGVNPNGMTKDLLGKNAKLLKTEQGKVEELKLPDGRGVETTGLALAPSYEEEGFTTCPNSASCKKECLGKTSGNYHKLGGGADLSEFKGPRLNSLKKTQAFLHDPHSFAVRLHDEIQAAKEMAGANNNHLGVRLNVLSDINPRVHKSIIEAHPDVTFYDYTKNNTNPIAPNHHYTYSSTGVSQEGVENPNTNWKQMRKRLQGGDNVAMAFSHKGHIPETVHDEETGQKFRVINGDTHDFRPMDLQPEGKHGVIVGLKNKKATGRMNEAHIDSQGFFVHHDPKEKVVLNKSGKPIFARDAKGKTIAQNKEVRIKPQYDELKLATNDDGDKV